MLKGLRKNKKKEIELKIEPNPRLECRRTKKELNIERD